MSVVNGLPESGFSFSVTAMLTPTAGAHPLGGVPLLKNDVSASARGRIGALQRHHRQIGRLTRLGGRRRLGPARWRRSLAR